MHPEKERRQFVRFRPKGGTMAVNQHALGPVINISMGGLSFQYMGENSAKPISDILGIFLGSDNILIDRIPTKIITDKLLSHGSTFLPTSTRQRSIQFTQLSKSQQDDLEYFINNKTTAMYDPSSPHKQHQI